MQRIKHRTFSDYEIEGDLDPLRASGKFHHKTLRARKKIHPDKLSKNNPIKYKLFPTSIWYLKECKTDFEAYREVVAQELLRLLIPGQPKTRIVRDNDKCYIASKEVIGLTCVEHTDFRQLKAKIVSGELKGLGKLQVASKFVQERDFKFGNLLFDVRNNLVKIDGGECFSWITNTNSEKDNFQSFELAALPQAPNYNAYNWLDVIKQGVTRPYPYIADPAIANEPHYRNDVNEGILSLLVLPKEFFLAFANSYVDDGPLAKIIADELINSQEKLRNDALKDESFCTFLSSAHCEPYFNMYLQNVKIFKTTGKNYILSKIPGAETKIHANFEHLKLLAYDSLTAYSPIVQSTISPAAAITTATPRAQTRSATLSKGTNKSLQKSVKSIQRKNKRQKKLDAYDLIFIQKTCQSYDADSAAEHLKVSVTTLRNYIKALNHSYKSFCDLSYQELKKLRAPSEASRSSFSKHHQNHARFFKSQPSRLSSLMTRSKTRSKTRSDSNKAHNIPPAHEHYYETPRVNTPPQTGHQNLFFNRQYYRIPSPAPAPKLATEPYPIFAWNTESKKT